MIFWNSEKVIEISQFKNCHLLQSINTSENSDANLIFPIPLVQNIFPEYTDPVTMRTKQIPAYNFFYFFQVESTSLTYAKNDPSLSRSTLIT